MNAVAFDTLKTARTLEGHGFSRDQAEALAEVVAAGRSIDLSHLATRDDLKQEIAGLRSEMKADFDATAHRLEMQIADVRSDVKVMEQRLIQMEHRMTIKLGGMLVVIIGLAVAALRYLPALY